MKGPTRLAEAFACQADHITDLQARLDDLDDALVRGDALVRALLDALQTALERIDTLEEDNSSLRLDLDLVTEREREGRDLG